MKNNVLKYALLAMMSLMFTLPALAQNEPPIDDDPPPAPIDNWVLLLVMAAVALGIYFIMKYNKKAIA